MGQALLSGSTTSKWSAPGMMEVATWSPRLRGSTSPATGDVGWDLIVVGALDQDLRNVEREQVAGVAGEVAVGAGGGGASHELVDLGPVVGEGE